MDRLLNQPSTAQARTFVQQELRKRGISTTVNQGLASALFTGNLIWDHRSIPNQLTFFALTCHAGFDTSSSSTSTELSLQASEGRGISDAVIHKMSKVSIHLVHSIDDLVWVLKAGSALMGIIAGDAGPVTDFLDDVRTFIELNADVFEDGQRSDPQFATKVLYDVDFRVQTFLARCAVADDRDDASELSLDSDCLADVNNNRYDIRLPTFLTDQFKTKLEPQPGPKDIRALTSLVAAKLDAHRAHRATTMPRQNRPDSGDCQMSHRMHWIHVKLTGAFDTYKTLEDGDVGVSCDPRTGRNIGKTILWLQVLEVELGTVDDLPEQVLDCHEEQVSFVDPLARKQRVISN